MGYLASELVFDGATDTGLRETTASASLSYRARPSTTLQLTLGALLGGNLSAPNGDHVLRVGPLAALTAVQVFVDGTGRKPFVTGALTLGGVTAFTPGARYSALDIKASGAIGKTLFGRLSPYAGVAIFGGPVFWSYGGRSVVGTDQHHFQILAGAALALPEAIDLFVEGSPLGERELSGGAGVAF